MAARAVLSADAGLLVIIQHSYHEHSDRQKLKQRETKAKLQLEIVRSHTPDSLQNRQDGQISQILNVGKGSEGRKGERKETAEEKRAACQEKGAEKRGRNMREEMTGEGRGRKENEKRLGIWQ